MNEPEIRAKIVDIKADKEKRVTIVSVEITRGTEVWHKAFRLVPAEGQIITLEDFQEQLKAELVKDLRWESAFSELEAKKGATFTLNFKK